MARTLFVSIKLQKNPVHHSLCDRNVGTPARKIQVLAPEMRETKEKAARSRSSIESRQALSPGLRPGR